MSLSVTLNGQPITKKVSGLVIRSASPGGFAAVSFNLNRKLDKAMLDEFTDCLVYDGATGEHVGGGRLLEPGRNDDGTWAVSCLGEGMASMQDVTTPAFYIDQNTDNWGLSSRTTKRLDFSTSSYPGSTTPDEPDLMLDPADSVVLSANSELIIINRLGQRCDMLFGSISYRIKSGISNSSWRTRLRLYNGDLSGGDLAEDDAFSSTISPTLTKVAGVDWLTARQVIGIDWKWHSSSTFSTTDTTWSAVRDVILRSQIYGRDGTLQTIAYNHATYVESFAVLTDWIVRHCPRLNALTGTIDQTSIEPIEQMAYLDGINGLQLAEDVQVVEPGFVWHVWEQSDDGTWPFNYTPLPTTIRYEASTADGFSAPSPSSEVYDEVVVTGKTTAGKDINVVVTRTVPSLAAAGLHRRATVPLGSEVWSGTAAAKVANEFLDEHATAPNAGTLTIARRIYDNDTGRWVQPWNIRPGGLIGVRGVQPLPDTSNPTGPDGTTVFRIVTTEYSEDAGTCTLELDALTLTETRAIARLLSQRLRKR